jgi:hypothetical protein
MQPDMGTFITGSSISPPNRPVSVLGRARVSKRVHRRRSGRGVERRTKAPTARDTEWFFEERSLHLRVRGCGGPVHPGLPLRLHRGGRNRGHAETLPHRRVSWPNRPAQAGAALCAPRRPPGAGQPRQVGRRGHHARLGRPRVPDAGKRAAGKRLVPSASPRCAHDLRGVLLHLPTS